MLTPTAQKRWLLFRLQVVRGVAVGGVRLIAASNRMGAVRPAEWLVGLVYRAAARALLPEPLKSQLIKAGCVDG